MRQQNELLARLMRSKGRAAPKSNAGGCHESHHPQTRNVRSQRRPLPRRPPRGARVCLRWPVRRSRRARVDGHACRNRLSRRLRNAIMTARAHVLVVDDDETVRRSYSAILAGGQCDAQMATDGAEALAAMEHQPFDLVLLD